MWEGREGGREGEREEGGEGGRERGGRGGRERERGGRGGREGEREREREMGEGRERERERGRGDIERDEGKREEGERDLYRVGEEAEPLSESHQSKFKRCLEPSLISEYWIDINLQNLSKGIRHIGYERHASRNQESGWS